MSAGAPAKLLTDEERAQKIALLAKLRAEAEKLEAAKPPTDGSTTVVPTTSDLTKSNPTATTTTTARQGSTLDKNAAPYIPSAHLQLLAQGRSDTTEGQGGLWNANGANNGCPVAVDGDLDADWEDGADEGEYYDEEEADIFDESNMEFYPVAPQAQTGEASVHSGAVSHSPNVAGNRGFREERHTDPIGATASISAPDVTQRRGVVGDFELLRLAKMGDVLSLGEFELVSGGSVVELLDNKERNALHYAVDCGSVPLVRYLASRGVKAVRDQRGMNPLDVAILSQNDDVIAALRELYVEMDEEYHKLLGTNTPFQLYAKELAKLAPPQPKFTMSKPVKPPPKQMRQFAFWGPTSTASTGSSSFNTRQLRSTPEELVRVVNEYSQENGEYGTTPGGGSMYVPHSSIAHSYGSHLVAVGVFPREETPATDPVGVAVGVKLSGAIFWTVAGVRQSFSKPAYITNLAVLQRLRGKGAAVALLRGLEDALTSSSAPSERCDVAVFVTKHHLPLQAIGTIKWHRRCIDPMRVFKGNMTVAQELFPDFFEYDEVLRADIVAKSAFLDVQAVAASGLKFSDVGCDDLVHWGEVFRDVDGQLEQLHAFLVGVLGAAPKTNNAAGLAYLPASVEDTREVFLPPGHRAFVYVSNGVISDFVVLRVTPPKGTSAANGGPVGADDLASAVCVYGLFTRLTGIRKMHMLLYLTHLMSCSTLFVPNMFGFTDLDMAHAHFEELVSHRHNLYAVKVTHQSAFAPVAMRDAYVPLIML